MSTKEPHDQLYRKVEALTRQLADLNGKAAQVVELIGSHGPYSATRIGALLHDLYRLDEALRIARGYLSDLEVDAK